MKITLEIPNFEIWGNNDETPTEFISELKDRIMYKISDDISKELRNRKIILDQKSTELFKKLENDFSKQLNEVADKFEEQTKKYINGLK